MEKVQKILQNYDFGIVSFQHLNILNVRSKSRIPTDCSSAICFVFPYYNKNAAGGNISAYCRVQDYHDIVMAQLKSIIEKLKNIYPDEEFVPFTDASPIEEIDMAVKAGLGAKGRNGLLITEKYGSYAFIGEILTTLALPRTNFANKGCFNCGICEVVCPGKALKNSLVETENCASHISQKKGLLTRQEEEILKKAQTVFGCDICQSVCPMNKGLPETENLFGNDILSTVTAENVEKIYKSRPFGWRGLAVLQRNLEIYNKK